nr:response regulator transcription factor [Alicyclobacillus macrosporangiidus]
MYNRIFLVEDDAALASYLKQQLERFGYEVHVAEELRNVAEEARRVQPDLILLDINLPYYDGFYWCRQIRSFSKTPIIFLSARDGSMDQVYALDSGGDEYITKPFHPDVLMAKIRALLRRTYGEYAEIPRLGEAVSDTVVIGHVKIDLRKLVVESDERTESLTKTEGTLLRELLAANGQVVARDTLLETIWDDAEFVDDNTLTVNVARLRRKLGSFGLGGAIVTVRGLGYRLDWRGGQSG